MEEIKLTDIADELLIVNKHTIDTLFSLENCSDCIALYIFYYKTAKWQKTDTIKASDEYVKKSLKWGIDKIRKTKQTLKENGLIDIVQRRKDGHIDGWYIKVSYIVSQRNIEDIKIEVENNNTDNQQIESKNTQIQQVGNATSGNEEINALKEYINSLKIEIDMLKDNKDSSASKKGHPSVEEVRAYCNERNNNVDPERFVDFYASKGWKIGKETMKDWKAAVRTWEKREDSAPKTYNKETKYRNEESNDYYNDWFNAVVEKSKK